jgi:hypothetical protein
MIYKNLRTTADGLLREALERCIHGLGCMYILVDSSIVR